jgi:N-acetyl-1-D-myo-inositol-2-amino-2-deoxy-alpha-D-glucopyranoside deacetylase
LTQRYGNVSPNRATLDRHGEPPVSRFPTLDRTTRLLVVAPHPDDETLSSGMLVQRCLAAGGQVDVLLLTDGDNNPWPQRWMERRIVIGARGRKRWGERRRLEVAAALGRLGVPADRLHGMGWGDMCVTRELRERSGESIARIGAVLDQVRPTLVVLPDLGDAHPDHGAAHVLVMLALASRSLRPALLTYMVHGTERSAPDDLLVPDEDPARQAVKVAAMREHRTQMALASRRMLGIASRPERFDQPPLPQAVTAMRLPWNPGVIARSRLRMVVADLQGVRTYRWREAPLERDGAGWVLPVAEAGPTFVKLTADMPSPYIFDHYGWATPEPEPVGLVARPAA